MSADTNAEDLLDAAAVHAAREEIVQALGMLAARPLDEQATALMRRAIERAESDEVRRAIRRLGSGGERPPLFVVPAGAGPGRATDSQPSSGWGPRFRSSLALIGGAA